LESRGFCKIVKENSEEAKQQQHFTLFIKVQILYTKVVKLAPRDRKAISTEKAVLWDRESYEYFVNSCCLDSSFLNTFPEQTSQGLNLKMSKYY